jgi:hypothetical protein
VHSRSEQICAFVLLHPAGVAEVAEPGYHRHPIVEAFSEGGCIATVKDIGHEPELIQRRHQCLRIDAVVGGPAPCAVDAAAESPMWIGGNSYSLDER